jgi:hypothetical protein
MCGHSGGVGSLVGSLGGSLGRVVRRMVGRLLFGRAGPTLHHGVQPLLPLRRGGPGRPAASGPVQVGAKTLRGPEEGGRRLPGVLLRLGLGRARPGAGRPLLHLRRKKIVECTRVARRYIFMPKLPIWIYFGGSWNGKRWYIL